MQLAAAKVKVQNSAATPSERWSGSDIGRLRAVVFWSMLAGLAMLILTDIFSENFVVAPGLLVVATQAVLSLSAWDLMQESLADERSGDSGSPHAGTNHLPTNSSVAPGAVAVTAACVCSFLVAALYVLNLVLINRSERATRTQKMDVLLWNSNVELDIRPKEWWKRLGAGYSRGSVNGQKNVGVEAEASHNKKI